MKRNLFAILLAVMLVSALVFFVAPSAKANTAGTPTVITPDELKAEPYNGKISQDNIILDLQGQNVEVNVADGITLSIINTKIREIDGEIHNAGKLTVNSGANIAPVAQDPESGMRFLTIGTTANDVTTYQCFPFNLAISKAGINTLAKNPDEGKEEEIEPALCFQASFMAFKPVIDEIDEYGFIVNDKEHPEDKAFTVGAVHKIYGDLQGSLRNDVIDNSVSVQAYIKINEVRYESSAFTSTPREILKTLNKQNLTPTDAQETRIKEMINSNDHLADLFTSVTKTECKHSAPTVATCVKASTCKNCDETIGTVDLIHGHNVTADNRYCSDCNGIEGINDGSNVTLVTLPDTSDAWQISGTIVRPLKDTAGPWNFGFEIASGDKELVFTANTKGIVFEESDSHSYYNGHATDKSQYTLHDRGVRLISVENNTVYSTMSFRAMIVDDVFYAWFWFADGNGPVLSWCIPLTEELLSAVGQDTWEKPFDGFAKGSEYNVSIRVNATEGNGSFTDLDVKIGDDVERELVPEYAASYSDIYKVAANGDVTIAAGTQTQIQFAGNSTAWELSGTINRDDSTKTLIFGFLIGDGSKTLELNAHNYGIVFGGLNTHTDTNYAKYAGHSNSQLTEYHKENTVQKQFTVNSGATATQMHFRAMIVDDVFYVWFGFDPNNLTLCWQVPLAKELVVNANHATLTTWNPSFKGFAPGSSYTLKLFTNTYNPANGNTNPSGSFTDLTVKTGSDVDFSKVPPAEYDVTIGSTTTHGIANGESTVSITVNQKSQIQFAGSSKAWELSGIINRNDTSNVLSFGFLIGDEKGNTLELNAHNMGFVVGARWEATHNNGNYDYSWINHSNSTISDYHKDNAVQKLFTVNSGSTATQIHFRAMIVDDVFYVWFWYDNADGTEGTPVLSWEVPLTTTLKDLYGNVPEKPFTGLAGGSYTLTLFNNTGNNPAGSFAELYAKTGSAVDTTPVDDLK